MDNPLIKIIVNSPKSSKGMAHIQTSFDIQQILIDGDSVLERVWSVQLNWQAGQLGRATLVLIDPATGDYGEPIHGTLAFEVG